MDERVFDVKEANALIPRLELFIGELQRRALQLRQEVSTVATEHGTVASELPLNQLLRLRPDLHGLVEDISRFIHEIEELGCVFQDLEFGLVDFPCEVAGERAYFCWQYGEKAVGYWHRVEDGFAGRRPLSRRSRAVRHYLQ